MSHRLTIVAPVALTLLGGAAWAQTDPQTVGVSVDGTVVEVPVDLAARACGISAETLLEQWAQLDTQIATMADTTVAADAADLAPIASPDDTQKAAGVAEPAEGSGADAAGAAATESDDAVESDTIAAAGSADAGATAPDLAPVVAAASPGASAAANPEDALGGAAEATEGTALSKAAVCEIDAQKAAELGIETPG